METPQTIAKFGGNFFLFRDPDNLPEGSEHIHSLDDLGSLSLDALGDLYSQVARTTSPKKFKDPKVAMDSIAYQAKKLPIFGEGPAPQGPAAAGQPARPPAQPTRGRRAKQDESYKLLSPEDPESLIKDLAPQAQEVFAIMTELAGELGTTVLPAKVVEDRVSVPEVAARLRTSQEPARILYYYKSRLEAKGLLQIVRA